MEKSLGIYKFKHINEGDWQLHVQYLSQMHNCRITLIIQMRGYPTHQALEDSECGELMSTSYTSTGHRLIQTLWPALPSSFWMYLQCNPAMLLQHTKC